MIQALPDRITAAIRVSIKCHLKGLNTNANLVIGIISIPRLETKTSEEIGEIFSCMWPLPYPE